MSNFKDMNSIVLVAMLQLANINNRFIILYDEVQASGGDVNGHWVLGPSLVNCRHNATIWGLCPTYERAKDDRRLSFYFHENET